MVDLEICGGPSGSPPTCTGSAGASRSLVRVGSSFFGILIVEKRAKETHCVSGKWIEITGR